MNLSAIKNAQWNYKKGVAQLIHNYSPLLTIEFGHRISEASFDKRKLQIKKQGFWKPQYTILENQAVLFNQIPTGFWFNRYEVRIGDRLYACKACTGTNYSVVYTNSKGKSVVTFKQNTWKWKIPVQLHIDESGAPANDIILLIIAGYATYRKLKQDSEGAMVAAVAAAS